MKKIFITILFGFLMFSGIDVNSGAETNPKQTFIEQRRRRISLEDIQNFYQEILETIENIQNLENENHHFSNPFNNMDETIHHVENLIILKITYANQLVAACQLCRLLGTANVNIREFQDLYFNLIYLIQNENIVENAITPDGTTINLETAIRLLAIYIQEQQEELRFEREFDEMNQRPLFSDNVESQSESKSEEKEEEEEEDNFI